MSTYTNSALTCARRCLREYDLRYQHQLDADGEPSEALAVGSLWHLAHETSARSSAEEVYRVIRERAPSALWAEKLCRLFAAHGWWWSNEGIRVVQSETTFSVALGDAVGDACPSHLRDHIIRGQIDGVVQSEDGRLGLLEYKTTSDTDLDAYFRKLRLDTQVSIYPIAARALGLFDGHYPDFVLYDVTRKPSIRQKKLTKADVALLSSGEAYYGETFADDEVALALAEKTETPAMYGARLTAEIGNEPERYFARREVHRTTGDYEQAVNDLLQQIEVVEWASGHQPPMMHRNPDACFVWHRPCDFHRLCSLGAYPRTDEVPDGFVRREHRHPELDSATTSC